MSEVGYVGMAKKRLGWKLRNPDAWKIENGKEENREYLDAMAVEIRQENERRLKEADVATVQREMVRRSISVCR